MNYRNSRFGKTLRALLVVMLVLITAPVLMIGAWIVPSVKADDKRDHPIQHRHEHALIESAPIGLPGPPHRPEPGVQYHPVIETSYREETVTIMVPEFDPKTGKTVMRKREHVRKVPVQTTRWKKSYTTTTESAHDQRTMKLANELRLMKEDDESRESKLKELRTQLEREFTELHQKQLAEIERTEKRLESLRALHEKRGENKNNIVQRRIDELLGKADPLRWNVSPVLPTLQISQPAPQSVNQWQNRSRTFSQLPTPHDPQQTIPVPAPPQTDPGPITGPFSLDRIATMNKVHEVEIHGPGTPNLDSPNSDTQKPGYQDERLGPVADDAPPSSSQPEPLPNFAQPRVGVPNSSLSEIFQLARNSAAANAELAEVKAAYERYQHRSNDAVAFLEFQKAKSKYEKCRREVKLINMQLSAFSKAMQRAKELAESTLQRASAKLRVIEAGYKQGINSEQELVDARYELDKARIALLDADANINQLTETMAAVQAFAKEQTDETDNEPAKADTVDE